LTLAAQVLQVLLVHSWFQLNQTKDQTARAKIYNLRPSLLQVLLYIITVDNLFNMTHPNPVAGSDLKRVASPGQEWSHQAIHFVTRKDDPRAPVWINKINFVLGKHRAAIIIWSVYNEQEHKNKQ
jgi:hypothetical protein